MPPNTKTLRKGPAYLTFREPATEIQLIIHGQCVFLFGLNKETHKGEFVFYTQDKTDGLTVSFTETEFAVKRIQGDCKYEPQMNMGGITRKSGAYYWFSLDSQNMCLYAGIGEARIGTAVFAYGFDPNDETRTATKLFLESLVCIELPKSNTITPLRLLKNPITISVPYCVKGTNELTMNDIACNRFLAASALPPAAQRLYGCIAGSAFTLNTRQFPDFANAIEYSIRTEGLWCNTRLKQKATEFGKDPQPLETYLRITLGQNNGDSPGIPYVMEIWPVGHYSPVHNHGGANAIIRVLHGSIQVSLYPYLCDDAEGVEPFATKDFVEGDITWISSTLNQVHQLKNLETSESACITIQCYMYDDDDKTHYDYFDYLGDKNVKSQYEPDSDMDFLEFKNLMRREWENRPRLLKMKPVKW